jgi:hypothetical protein
MRGNDDLFEWVYERIRNAPKSRVMADLSKRMALVSGGQMEPENIEALCADSHFAEFAEEWLAIQTGAVP